MIRRVVFRLHLTVAIAAGLVILILAATGVILASEELVTGLAERRYRVTMPRAGEGERIPPDALVAAAEAWGAGAEPPFAATSIEYRAGTDAAVRVHAGRERRVFVDPYTGEVLGGGMARLEGFFESVNGWHRWLSFPDSAIRRGRAVTAAANVALLLLLLTGPILWIPRRITRRSVAEGLLFRRGVKGVARALNWHYVIGIWSVVPLLMIAVTGMVMSYPSVGDRVYPVVGGAISFGSVTAGPGVGQVGGDVAGEVAGQDPLAAPGASLAAALAATESRIPGWRAIVLTLPRPRDAEVRVEVRAGRSGQPQKAGVMRVDRRTGAALSWESFADATPSRRAREFLRYAHTGEYWGLAGQVVAGLVAVGTALMVWTGLSVALLMFRFWRQKRSG
ncbi:MAG: PepSY-associated TM helix domain-containing protein [Gemmatimonadetes bacterium]|nr:PepSY-associated TM helix domain-containing protein [Gemmatimonadota bacterium]